MSRWIQDVRYGILLLCADLGLQVQSMAMYLTCMPCWLYRQSTEDYVQGECSRKVEIIDERWRSVPSKSNSQSQSNRDRPENSHAGARLRDQSSSAHRTGPKKNWRDNKRLTFFSWYLVCRVWFDPVYLPIRLNAWLPIIPCEEPDFPFTMDGVDGAWADR